ncbi:hypothetical protein DFJ73DRAFT_840701 [Zopfochytrium polystomum]|nr:hypothetical protein DFJ73DRAFT_840701 [Zopfochytrium polystomum]
MDPATSHSRSFPAASQPSCATTPQFGHSRRRHLTGYRAAIFALGCVIGSLVCFASALPVTDAVHGAAAASDGNVGEFPRGLHRRSGPAPAPPTCAWVYIVMEGQDCGFIAKQLNLTTAQLQSYNPSYSCTSIIPGKALCITPPTCYCTPRPYPLYCCQEVYVIKSGDSCWSIAQSYGVTVEYLQAINPSLDCYASPIYPFQQLCVRPPPTYITPVTSTNFYPYPVTTTTPLPSFG